MTRICVIVHVYYEDVAKEIANRLREMKITFDLYVSISERSLEESNKVKDVFQGLGARYIMVENKGQDIYPFLKWMQWIRASGFSYEYCLKLHTKKSVQEPVRGFLWMADFLNGLVGRHEECLSKLSSSSVGMVSVGFYRTWDMGSFEVNSPGTVKLCRLLGVEPQPLDFYVGTMFWCKFDVLAEVLIKEPDDYGFSKVVLKDAQLEHSFERVIPLIYKHLGYSLGDIKLPNTVLREFVLFNTTLFVSFLNDAVHRSIVWMFSKEFRNSEFKVWYKPPVWWKLYKHSLKKVWGLLK